MFRGEDRAGPLERVFADNKRGAVEKHGKAARRILIGP